MNKITLAETDIAVSRFVFGTASLFNIRGKAERIRLLEAAIDAGFSHFDTAPYYGFGLAESELGEVLKRHPEVTVTTKVGIYSPGGERQSATSVLARKVIGRVIPAASKPAIDWDIDRAKKMFADSCRRLNRECIDIYMLHEPDVSQVDADAWCAWMEALKRQGLIRAFGIAVDETRLTPFLAAGSPLAGLVQTTDSNGNREADQLPEHGRPLQITYGYVSAAKKLDKDVSVHSVLRQALRRNPQGAIIVSTRREERLKQFPHILENADD